MRKGVQRSTEDRLVDHIWLSWIAGLIMVMLVITQLARGLESLRPETIQSADLNLDGAVDLRDFAHFQNQFGGPIPPWLRELIDGFELGGVMYSPLYVWQYRYGGELTFYVPPRCCDVMAVLYDVRGERLCHPAGGLEGQGDGQCPDFFDERTDEILIWEDPRA